MIAKGDIVLVDTNVIIEAHRVRCWRVTVNFLKVETVEKCSEEAATGDKRRTDYVAVDVQEMKKVVAVHAVSLLELAEIETRLAEPDRIDMGEKHLLPAPLKQREFRSGDVLITVADFPHEAEKIAIYCDGFAYHGTPEKLAADAQKRNHLQSRGWLVLTFWGRTILRNPERCEEQIWRALCHRKAG